jgi:hypothetical protein
LAPLRVHFTQGPSVETLRQYLTGLLSEHPHKNCDTLTEIVPETNEQQFNHLLTNMVWDEHGLNRQRIGWRGDLDADFLPHRSVCSPIGCSRSLLLVKTIIAAPPSLMRTASAGGG